MIGAADVDDDVGCVVEDCDDCWVSLATRVGVGFFFLFVVMGVTEEEEDDRILFGGGMIDRGMWMLFESSKNGADSAVKVHTLPHAFFPNRRPLHLGD